MCKVLRIERPGSGQGLVEMLFGMTVIVLVGLFLIDLFTLGVGASINDELAKRAARAAASKARQSDAAYAVEQIRKGYPANGIVSRVNSLQIRKFDTRAGGGVRVRSVISIRLPVPVPFSGSLSNVSFRTEAEEPIVGIEAKSI